jgi:hypothetical protein
LLRRFHAVLVFCLGAAFYWGWIHTSLWGQLFGQRPLQRQRSALVGAQMCVNTPEGETTEWKSQALRA